MAETRIKFSSIVKNQLPTYVENEFPLISEFLKQYYIGQEYKSGPVDLIQNIDQYIKVDEQTSLNHFVTLSGDLDEFATTINLDPDSTTDKFPDSYGLLKIGDEVITYTGKTTTSFTGCLRGFVGVTSYKSDSNPGELVFSSTSAAEHKDGATIENLSCLFLKEFLNKTKIQFLPGLSDRPLSSDLSQNVFIKQAKDFYTSKGTDDSYKILFKALYGVNVEITKPRDYLFTPSNARNLVTSNFLVESINGDPSDLESRTIFQGDNDETYTAIYDIEKVNAGTGKTFYKLSFDDGYNRDSRAQGSTVGQFKVAPKTHIIGNVSAGSTFIDVDSTIGFPNSGEIYVDYPNAPVNKVGIVSYTSKTITQFLGCSNITDTLIDGDTLSTEDFASVKPSEEPTIEVRITPVLSGFSKQDGIFDYKPEDKFDIKSLGIEDDSFKFKNWLYNNPVKYAINKIELISSVSPKTYKLTLNKENYLSLGDSVKIENLTETESHDAEVIDIITDKVVVIKTTGTINVAATYTLLRRLRKAKSATISGINKFHANVQNVYKKQYGDSLLVASNSLPSFKDVPLVAAKCFKTFSGTFSGETFTINDHGFYTGESVYYTPQRTQTTVEIDGEDVIDTSIQSSLFGGDTGGEGVYYVFRVDSNNIKLAKSPANLYTSKFVSASTTTVTSNTIELTETSNRVIDSQRLYREVSTPINNDVEVETVPGATGILVNGVEVLNYKSKDIVHTGRIEKIDVASPGNGFDVINPPDLVVTDSVGSGASGFLAISGQLRELQIIDRGFDFTETPTVSITGGNGSNARALVNTKLISHSVEFFSDVQSARVSIGANNSTIGFSTYHKFRNGEEVVYKPNSQQIVGGLSTSATYFAEVIDATTIKLHDTLEQAIVGINTVVLSSHGIGKHTLECVSRKSIIDSINIVDSGTGYENKKRTVASAGINTSSDIITVANHDYKSGEVLRYTAGASAIGGLSDGTNYYATVIDSNQFKLSEIGPATDENFFYRTKQYIDLTSGGTGTQIFNYPPISVTVEGPVGIATVTGIESSAYKAEVQPIFRGELTSVHLSNRGSGYGTSEIINFNKLPDVTVTSGVNAQVKPIVTADGRIIEVIIENVGSNYTSTPNLEIISTTGIGCVLTPIFSNGRLSEVKVIEPGTGYVSGDVSIEITPSETDFSFIPQVQRWRVNLFEKLYNNNLIGSDDTVAQRSLSDDYGLQCYSLYAPRPLREMVYSVGEGGETLYGKPDLKLVNSQETEFTDHSPILGWAYDGNPIYGPYGYTNSDGGVVTMMKSSYRLNTSRVDGPSVTIFPLGFFVEDFTYHENNDDSYLDRNNGRFCVTPEYPNGTYAYFVTVNPDSIESSGLFENYKIPTFPYVLGDKYHSTPNEFNFSKSSNQDDYDIVENNWCRNTISYNLRESGIDYPYIYSPNNLSQTGKIVSTNRGTVSRVDIKSAGDNYKVGDTLNFSGDVTGFGAAGRVSRLKGRSVNSISAAISEISNVEFIPSTKKGSYLVEATSPHNFENLDIVNVSGVSTTSSKIEGFYTVGVSSERFAIVGLGTIGVAVGDTSITGLVTFFNVSSSLIDSNIVPNDILGIGTEQVKVLNVDKENSRFRVLREVNGTVGSIHTIGSILSEVPRRFEINSGFKTRYAFQKNKEIYFEPQETVGLGTTAVGIGSVLQFDSFGLNTVGLGTTFGSSSLAVPIKSLYFKDHNLQTGDLLTYSPNGGQGIVYNDNGEIGVAKTLTDGQQLFVAKISKDLIGIATQRVGLGSTGGFIGIGNTTTTLFFTALGTGTNHSFATNYSNITGDLAKRTVTVTTDANHGIGAGHIVDIDVNPSFATTYVVKYNDENRRVLVGIETFSAVGVNSTTNTITILNHGYESGDKVIHSSTVPCQGLENDKIYYIVKVDDNNFKLSNTYHDSTKLIPSIVGISSASFGEFGLVNPSIKAFRSSTLNFDLSDSSLGFVQQSTDYSAFRLNFYLDDTYTRRWETDGSSSSFSVSRTGIPGTSSANVSVSIGNTTPERLYYCLDPVSDANLPTVKSEIIKDSEILNHNTVISQNSVYNGNRRISIAGTNFFTFELPQNPESNSYVSTSSSITYTTDCTHTTGPISAVEVTSAGKNYTTLPSIESINSIEGVRGDLVSVSEDIGVIEKVKINDVGYDFPTDSTLKPSASLPQIINVDSFAKVDFIDIVSGGKGYSAAPELLFFDGKTGNQITDISTRYSLGDSEVTILSNTRGINNSTPTVLPIKNTNGVGISTVGFNTVTKDVTVTMAVGFSTSFPFEVGDEVMIENISTVGVGTTIKGYNSKEYGYKLFTLTEVTPNIGGIGSVAYNLSNELNEGEIPGEFDVINSAGQIIAQKNFPTFDVVVTTSDYFTGEKVTTNGKEGIVQSWDRPTKTLRVLSSDNFVEGEVIRGLTSELSGTALKVTSYESYFETDVSAQIFSGNQTDSGFLNDILQRVQDNFYYQNFSYSLKSTIPFDDWNDVISSVNHTLGYKKFGDLQIESTNLDGLKVGISTELTDVSIVSSLDGFVDTNCVFDFDIATENNVNLSDGSVLSDEIILNNKILTDFTESFGNRVLSIDDISPQFNSNPRATAFSILDTFNLDDVRFRKYFTYLKDKRFTQERQGLIVDLIHDGTFGYLNQYARVESVYDQGSFDFSISGSDGQLLFFPTKSTINDYHLTAISYNLNDNYLSTGSTSIGGVLIDSESTIVNSGSSATIVSIGNTYHSLKVLVEIAPDVSNPSYGNTATINGNEFEAQELNIVHDGSDVSILEYGKLTTSPGGLSATGFGTYTAYLDGSNIKVDFNPSGIGTNAVVNAIVVGLSSVSSGISTLDLKHARLQSTTTNITSSGSPTENVITEYPSHLDVAEDRYDAGYFMIQVHDTTNDRYEFLEYFVVDDHIEGATTGETFETEWANIQTHSGLGTFGSRVIADSVGLAATTQVLFTPVAGIDATVHVYTNALRIEDDSKDTINFINGTIETGSGDYTGTERDIKRSFNLTHKNDEIFERIVTGSGINTSSNSITVPNHFYVTGEQIEYASPGIGNSGSIGIGLTTFPVTGVTTALLPTTGIFAVKINDNTIQLARSAEDALKSIPQVLDLTSFGTLGVGAAHTFTATNQNAKVLVAIDNLIQSPIVSTAVTTTLEDDVVSTDNTVDFTGITSFFGGDLIKVGGEIMKIEGVGIGSTNRLSVRRGWMGTNIQTGISSGDLVTKVVGNYNIVANTLTFSEAPFGNVPVGSPTNPPDQRDYVGISTSSMFQGRSFMRTAQSNTTNETYYKNYIFDDLSDQFNGIKNEFTLKSDGSDITGINNEGAIVLVNDIFQVLGEQNNYTLSESTGITSITFDGTARNITNDVGLSTFPRGGMLVSVGSSAGFGLQPLVAAGGEAVVSAAGTITSVSIGNSGSGYRSGIQTDINVVVELPNVNGTTLVPIGIASATDGNVTSVAITTDRVFYAPRSVSNVLYDNVTGITTITTSTAHGLSANEVINVSGIAFTCNYSGSEAVNVTNALYDNVTGILTVTTAAPHNLNTSGQRSDVLLTGLGFTCGLGPGTHVYPRTTDPIYCGAKVTAVNSATEFEVNAGVTTVPTFYQSGGTAQPALIAPRVNNNSASGFDPASQGSSVLRIIDNTTFEINSGLSTRAHFYARCGTVAKPLDIIFDSPLSYTNLPLDYVSGTTGLGTDATIDVVVGQGSSVISFEINNTGYGYGNGERLTVSVGGTTGIPTTSSFIPTDIFEIQVEKVINDEFTGWSVGVFDTFDDVTNFIDGTRIDFPLIKAGIPVSINKSKGSKIELDQLLLVFVNEILQKPGDSYKFVGGSQITFAEPLKIGDTLNICFYKGSGDALDVIDREVIETLKYGDEVTLNYNPDLGQKPYQQEDARTISSITNVDKCETLPYFGPGNTTDTTFERPLTWCRQTQDKIINGQEVGKDREIYEPVINPVANIISSVGIGSTTIYVDRLRPLFDLNNENPQATFRNTIQKGVKLVNPVVVTGAAATAVVSSGGTITSIMIDNGGVGYSTTPDVSIGVGSVTATAEATIANGVVTGVTITNPGSGYTTTNPPLVLIGPPAEQTELCDVVQNTGYSGDSGIIVGLGTTSIGVGATGMMFHLHIPLDSEMRDANLVGTAVTLSGISTGDYFIVRNSNLGAASTSISALGTDNATVVGIGSEFLDNVYVVNKMELETQVIAGVSTNVIKVSVNTNMEPDGITGLTTGAFLGEYSWGKVNLEARTKELSYPAHTMSGIGTNGLTGISTSSKLYRSRYIRFKKFG
tara:strand:- start:1473 stop:14264 length:12792 start_codon:yes stop_codon:yes gene_type:complete